MLEGKNLSFRYRKMPLLFENVHFTLPDGKVLSIMGPNGAGKSTLLKCINRIHRPTSGTVLYRGTDVRSLTNREVGQLFGYVPQDVGGGLDINVIEAVMLGRTPYIRIRPTEKDRSIVFEAIVKLGLGEYAFRSLNELSGGERQRVFLARALVQEPKVLLLDEPTSNLDIRYQLETMELIRKLAREKHISVVMIIHDLSLAYRYSDRVLMMRRHAHAVEGPRNDVITCDSVREVYQVHVRVESDGEYPFINPLCVEREGLEQSPPDFVDSR
jgi:iron complex transport system ATP-binding protein